MPEHITYRCLKFLNGLGPALPSDTFLTLSDTILQQRSNSDFTTNVIITVTQRSTLDSCALAAVTTVPEHIAIRPHHCTVQCPI